MKDYGENKNLKIKSLACPIPIYLITGFLGAGKTSLLQDVLRKERVEDYCIFVNEYSSQSIDHTLLAQQIKQPIHILENGCLCCALQNPLIEMLLSFKEKYAQEKKKLPKKIFIETSGIFDPISLLQQFFLHDSMQREFCFAGMISVIDVFHGHENLNRFIEAKRQIIFADLIVITKTEKAPKTIVDSLTAKLKQYNATAPIYEKSVFLQKNLSFKTLKDQTLKGQEKNLKSKKNNEILHEGFQEFHLNLDQILGQHRVTLQEIETFLGQLHQNYGPLILRLKAIFYNKVKDEAFLIQSVQGIFQPLEKISLPKNEKRSYFVFITLGELYQEILYLFRAFFNIPFIDQADREAFLHNPLAITQLKF